jgi:hypothetical protein
MDLVWTVRIVVLKYGACTLKDAGRRSASPVPTSTSIRSRLPSAPGGGADGRPHAASGRRGDMVPPGAHVGARAGTNVEGRSWALSAPQREQSMLVSSLRTFSLSLCTQPHPPLLSASRKAPGVLSCVRLVHLRVCGDSVGVAVLRTLCACQPRRGRRRVYGRRRALGERGTAYVISGA